MAHLPEWLDALIPELTLPVKLKYVDGKYYAHYPDGKEYPDYTLSEPFDSFEESYDSVKGESGLTVTFDDSLPETIDLLFNGLITQNAGNGRSRAFISSTEADSLHLLEDSYKSWMKFAENEYLQHTDDFLCAYYFVDRHPCFWTRDQVKSNRPGWDDNWRTYGYTQRIDHSVRFNADSSTRVTISFETGPHHAPDYRIHSCDLRLETYGESYEDAMIKLAAKIHKFYNLDGSPRENVEYEKSPLEKLLLERLAADRARQSSSDIPDPYSNQ